MSEQEKNNIINEASTWAKNRSNEIRNKWVSKDSVDVTFKDIGDHPIGVNISLTDGVIINIKQYNQKYYIVDCWMDGTLSDHYHSTHKEVFICIDGEMRDNINKNILLKKGDITTYDINKNHEPTGKCELIIIGYK